MAPLHPATSSIHFNVHPVSHHIIQHLNFKSFFLLCHVLPTITFHSCQYGALVPQNMTNRSYFWVIQQNHILFFSPFYYSIENVKLLNSTNMQDLHQAKYTVSPKKRLIFKFTFYYLTIDFDSSGV